MDSNNLNKRNLLELTVRENISCPSARRAKVFDAKKEDTAVLSFLKI
jgi:hypothetical protein